MYNEYIVLKGYALVGYSLGNDTYARRFKGKGFIVTNIFSVCVKAQGYSGKASFGNTKMPLLLMIIKYVCYRNDCVFGQQITHLGYSITPK